MSKIPPKRRLFAMHFFCSNLLLHSLGFEITVLSGVSCIRDLYRPLPMSNRIFHSNL